MPCARCRAVLRVPAEMIGRSVACKFCHQAFRADPARVLVRDPSGSVPLTEDSFLDASQYVVPSASAAGIPIPRAERSRSQSQGQEPSGRILVLEQALDRVLAEHKELQVELRRLRVENETLLRAEREELDQFRSQLVRLEQIRDTIEREQDRSRLGGQSARPFAQGSSGRHAAPSNGHGRVLSLRPLQRPGSVTRAHSGHRGGGVALREALGLLANCERMTDRLVNELKTTQQERDQQRAVFERILERLQDDLARARSEFATGRAPVHSAPGRAADSEGEHGRSTAESHAAAESLDP
jgi:hypothetical protein